MESATLQFPRPGLHTGADRGLRIWAPDQEGVGKCVVGSISSRASIPMGIQDSEVTAIGVISLFLVFPAEALAQNYSIQNIAAASKDKVVHISSMEDEAVTPLSELSRQADLILDARLVRPHGYLSQDGMSVNTDYDIVPNRFLRSKIVDVSMSRNPGQQPPLRLTVPGGEVTVAGKTVISSVGMAKPITAGSRYLVFATRVNANENRFVATAGSGGLFEVMNNGHLDPVLRTSQPNPDFKGVSFDEVSRKLQAAPQR
jgi:hypothetical protein